MKGYNFKDRHPEFVVKDVREKGLENFPLYQSIVFAEDQ